MAPGEQTESDLQLRKLKLEIASLELERGARIASSIWRWILAFLALLLIGFVVALAVSAAGSRGVVIERFAAEKGVLEEDLTEEALSQAILHRLSSMRAYTVGKDRRFEISTPTAEWLDDLRVEIPQTGVTVADIHRTMRRWFGRDAYVRGQLSRGDKGCTFVARVWEADQEGLPMCASSQGEIIKKAAESVFRQVDPYLFALYISEEESRREEADTLLREAAFGDAETEDRVSALNALALNLLELDGECEAASSLLLRAIDLDQRRPIRGTT